MVTKAEIDIRIRFELGVVHGCFRPENSGLVLFIQFYYVWA